MHYALTFFGVLLKAVTVALLQLFGETYTSEAVSNVTTVIALIFIVIGVIMAFKEESGSDLGKALLVHAGIVIIGFALVWLLTWSLIIGFGGFVLLIMLVYFMVTTI